MPDTSDVAAATGTTAPGAGVDRLRTIAVVDNNAAECHWTRAALRSLEGCVVQVHRDSREFLAGLRQGLVPDLALVDYRMPIVDGLQVGAALAAAQGSHRARWILMTGLPDEEVDAQARGMGALDVLTKPLRADDLRMRVRRMLGTVNAPGMATPSPAQAAGPGYEPLHFEVLARLASLRDDTTGSHVQRMAHYAVEIARRLGLPADHLAALLLAAPLHDIGKIGVPDRILNKRGALDDDEMAIMRRHAAYGAAVLRGSGSPVLEMAQHIALSHHEKFDGTGYPQGLQAESIPLEARIVAVADVFDALTTRRPYKEAWPVADAVAYVRSQAGRHFDPRVVEAFVEALPDLLAIRERMADASTEVEPAELAA